MKRTSLLLATLVLGCSEGNRAALLPAQLAYRAPSTLASFVKLHAYESRLSIDGIALRDSTLYVATNVGLLEVRHAQIVRIAQWFPDDNVVSGPWYDETHDRVWLKRDHDDVLLVQHDSGWREIALPKPPNGEDYTRGEMLEGFRGISDSGSFRLLGAGTVWQWTSDSTWTAQERPPADPLNGTIGFAGVSRGEVTVVTSGGCAYLTCKNDAYWRSPEGWQKPLRLSIGSVEDVVAASGEVFVRGGKGELLRIAKDSVLLLTTPGPCEAIARTSTGQLMASFRGAGLFVLDSGWRKLFDDPSERSTGEQRAFIVERRGQVALATTTVPQLKPGSSDKFYQSGNLGLWISDGPKLVRVALTP